MLIKLWGKQEQKMYLPNQNYQKSENLIFKRENAIW